jgi:hypothetical protein
MSSCLEGRSPQGSCQSIPRSDGAATGDLAPAGYRPTGRQPLRPGDRARTIPGGDAADLGYVMERVARIELALSAWEVDRIYPWMPLTRHGQVPGVAAPDRFWPLLIARWSHGDLV